jgi:hypothetical protein
MLGMAANVPNVVKSEIKIMTGIMDASATNAERRGMNNISGAVAANAAYVVHNEMSGMILTKNSSPAESVGNQ